MSNVVILWCVLKEIEEYFIGCQSVRKQKTLIFTKIHYVNLSKFRIRLWRHLTFHDICPLGPITSCIEGYYQEKKGCCHNSGQNMFQKSNGVFSETVFTLGTLGETRKQAPTHPVLYDKY